MSNRFYLSPEQQEFVKNLLDIDDLTGMSIIFEVNPGNPERRDYAASNESSGRNVRVGTCDDGGYGPDCP